MSEPTKEALEVAGSLISKQYSPPRFTIGVRGIALALDAFAAQRVDEARIADFMMYGPGEP